MSRFLNRKTGALVEKKLCIYEGLGQNSRGWSYGRKNYYVKENPPSCHLKFKSALFLKVSNIGLHLGRRFLLLVVSKKVNVLPSAVRCGGNAW